MAQSDVTHLTADSDESSKHRGDGLSKREARLVVCKNSITVAIEGDVEEVQRRYEHMANAFDTTVEKLTADVKDYPHFGVEEGLVPADESYNTKER
jgi:hypothetical protein